MDTINLDVLTRPFSPEQIRQREGRGGKMLNYLETHAVITRLNEAFGGAWSFEVVDYKTMEGEIVVQGKLSAGGVTKMQFGSSEISRRKDDGKPVSIGDDLKAAASDALKKCATLFGVGLHLYEKAERPAQQRPAQQADRRQGRDRGRYDKGSPSAATAGPSTGRIEGSKAKPGTAEAQPPACACLHATHRQAAARQAGRAGGSGTNPGPFTFTMEDAA